MTDADFWALLATISVVVWFATLYLIESRDPIYRWRIRIDPPKLPPAPKEPLKTEGPYR